MNYIAIAVLRSKAWIMGYRLLNKKTKCIEELRVDDLIIRMMGGMTIENLGLSEHKIVGTNGAVSRLAQVDMDGIKGKSPLIVVNQLGDKGYTVSDYKGYIIKMSTENALKYAKENGIANGKIVTKDGKSFISAINGTYDKIEADNVKISEAYTGKLINNKRSLLQILVSMLDKEECAKIGYYSANNVSPYYVISYKDGEIEIKTSHDKLLSCSKKDIQSTPEYNNGKYTLTGRLARYLDINNLDHITDIIDLLYKDSFRNWVEKSIRKSCARNYEEWVQKESLSDILELPYLNHINQIAFEHIDEVPTQTDLINKELVKEYLGYLRIINKPIVSYTNFYNKKIALYRVCEKQGINYEILDDNEGYKIQDRMKKKYIEEIYDEAYSYSNIQVKGNKMRIIGFDGVYEYDMELVRKQYKRSIAPNNIAIKAKLLGLDYAQEITDGGVLKRLKSISKIVDIPSSVKILAENSIELTEDNKVLILGENIEEFEPHFITGNFNLKEIIVRCGNIQSMKQSIQGVGTVLTVLSQFTVNIDREATVEEIMSLVDINSVEYIKCKSLTDDMVNDIVVTLMSGIYMYINRTDLKKANEKDIKEWCNVYNTVVGIWDKINSGITNEGRVKIAEYINYVRLKIKKETVCTKFRMYKA